MSNWIQVEPKLVEAVASLPPKAAIMVLREFPGCQLEFSHIKIDGVDTLRTEVCNNETEDQPRLRDRGWELESEFSGIWRRDVAWPTDAKDLKLAVAEGTHVLKNVWKEVTLNGFSYHAWIDVPPRPWWMFWKPKTDRVLTFPDLGIPQGE